MKTEQSSLGRRISHQLSASILMAQITDEMQSASILINLQYALNTSFWQNYGIPATYQKEKEISDGLSEAPPLESSQHFGYNVTSIIPGLVFFKISKKCGAKGNFQPKKMNKRKKKKCLDT